MRGFLKTLFFNTNNMSKKQKKAAAEHNIELVEGALSKSEQYIEDNQKSLSIIVAVIVVIVGAYLAYDRFYVGTQEDQAQSQMYRAEQYFEIDSFNLALNGDGNFPGFLELIDDYGVTDAANLAHYYAGICYLNMGQNKEAVDYLTGFESRSKVIAPIAYGATGDAYMEMEETEQAATYYQKAASVKNDFTAPPFLMKAAFAYEKLGENKKALKAYQTIKKNYKNSTETRSIDKYIARIELAK